MLPRSVALSVNRRQREPWEQQALGELRHGNVAAAVAAYGTHQRLIRVESREDTVNDAVNRWFEARDAGLSPVLVAGTNELVAHLNRAVVQQLIHNGELADEPAGGYGREQWREGDRVVLRRNSTQERDADGRPAAVLNGQVGIVISMGDRTMTIGLDRGRTVRRDAGYLARGGWVEHGYAATSTRAQGGTWDVAIACGADGLYREAAYVELSRGRVANWLVSLRRKSTKSSGSAPASSNGMTTASTSPARNPLPTTRR